MKIELIEKIEGEAFLDVECKKGRIKNAYVRFPHYRGIEEILRGRSPLDALVINPRVCGICGHAHLHATALALEKLVGFEPNEKVRKIREITRFCEMVQNHVKWFYLVIFAILDLPYDFRSIQAIIQKINRLSAIFGGQWPHSSYVLPGGITCDPSVLDIVQAKRLSNQSRELLEKLLGDFELKNLSGDLRRLFDALDAKGLLYAGKSLDRFITFGNDSYVESFKILSGKKRPAKLHYIEEFSQPKSRAKGVVYKGKFYETGPLARTMQRGERFVKQLHRRYKDSVTTRIFARIYEAHLLLKKIQEHLQTLDIGMSSYEPIEIGDGEAIVAVEAARGSLVHRVCVKEGKIVDYSIITPTQWNLANGRDGEPSLIQTALQNARCEESDIIFRSFDICSVCTTH